MFWNQFIQKIIVLTFTLFLLVAGLMMFKSNPFGLGEYQNYVASAVLILSSFSFLLYDVSYSITDRIETQTNQIQSRIKEMKSSFKSTVKTLTFITDSKDRDVNLGLTPEQITDCSDISGGNLEMRIVPTFLDTFSTAVLVEGSSGSKICDHAHSEIVSIFVIEGEVEILVDHENGDEETFCVGKGEAITIDPYVNREVLFEKSSCMIFVYTPPLKSFNEGGSSANRLQVEDNPTNVRIEENSSD